MGLNYGILSKREYYDHLIQRVKHTGWAWPRRRGEEMEEQKTKPRRTKYMELKKISYKTKRKGNNKIRIREIIISKN